MEILYSMILAYIVHINYIWQVQRLQTTSTEQFLLQMQVFKAEHWQH